MPSSLAIVIPAYKATFLPDALDSIAAQTCQDFALYIGDDCSPHQLEVIVNRYKDRLNLVYHRFDSNLGGKDLVAQWERCIAMTQGEPYIWLFSDDDVMEPRCVEEFLNLPEDIKTNYLVHFNIHQINDVGNIIRTPLRYPDVLKAKEYLDAKLFQRGIVSFVVEFIFPRWTYEKTGGIQKNDLAWGSDFMTWLKFTEVCRGIYTIHKDDTHVRWRISNENISPNKSRAIQIRKINSQIAVARNIKDFLARNDYRCSFTYVRFVLGDIKHSLQSFTYSDIRDLCQKFRHDIGFPIQTNLAEMELFFLRLTNIKK